MNDLSNWFEESDDMDKRFWGTPYLWPNDTNEYVFLARAFDLLGLKQFGYAWNYRGPKEPRDDSDQADIDHIDECEAAEDRYIEMRLEVRAKMIDLFQQNQLGTALRLKEGGPIKPDLVEAMWNSENCARRFKRCDISENAPFSQEQHVRATHYIFVVRNDFEQYLRSSQDRMARKVPNLANQWKRGIRSCYKNSGPPDSTPHEEIRQKVKKWAKDQGEDLKDVSPSYLATILRQIRTGK